MAIVRGLFRRRNIFRSVTSLMSLIATGCAGKTTKGSDSWDAHAAPPPRPVPPGPWVFFTAEEGAAVEAMVDQLIPPDPQTPGGKDAGCAVFIDRQLAGPYGRSEALYMRGPFANGTPEQGAQSPLTPAARYRQSLAALNEYTRRNVDGQTIAQLSGARLGQILKGLESGDIQLAGADGKAFFSLLLTDTKAGFFSDPIYGGNRGMASWTMIGFPGARYDYRDWVQRHNERYPHGPISIADTRDG